MYFKRCFCFPLFFATFITWAVGDFCFRNRVPSGPYGQCQGRIHNIDSAEDCCRAGGAGWTTKQNGKRCSAACSDAAESLVVQPTPPIIQPTTPVVQPRPPVGRPNQDEVKFCFGTRQPHRRSGLCGEVIGERTREDCCRQGGKGWTNSLAGRRCEDACLGVEDIGPVHYCFSRRNNRGRCVQSLGQKTRLRCCQDGGVGWSPNSNGRACESACLEASGPVTLPPIEVIHGGWSEWSDWDQCSVTCGEGTQSRLRTCTNPAPENGGDNCVGGSSEVAFCDEGPCPIDGGWGRWRDTGECSATCYNTGESVYRQMRRRCNNPVPQFGGRECQGPSIKNRRCTDLPDCPVDGGWSEYGTWSECSQTCEEGIQTRRRTCTNPPPQYGGRDCEGSDTEEQVCRNRRVCPVHGGWSDWGSWSPCDSPRCGVDGTRFRSRSCTNPRPKNRGNYCVGAIIDRETCSKCQVPGGWSDWSPWGPCSGNCGGGDFRLRYRICNNPLPQNGGWCEGDFEDFGDCENLDPCPDDFEGSGSGDGASGDVTPWPCDDEDSCNYGATRRQIGDDSFWYSFELSIEVPEDESICQEFDIYSLSEYNPGCGKQVSESIDSYNFDYSNNHGPNVPVEPSNGGDGGSEYSFDFYDNVGQGGAQPDAPQEGVEANNVGDSDYSFSYDNNVGQGGAQAGAPQAAIEANNGNGSDSYSFDDVEGAQDAVEQGSDGQGAGGNNGVGDNSYSYYSVY